MACPSTTLFVLFPFFRGQLLFPPYLFLQSCVSQSYLSSFCILSCSAALLDVQCSMACSCTYPMVVHLVPGRGNGHQDPAGNLKESSHQAAFYQVSMQCQAKRAGMKSRRCDEGSQERGKDCQVPAAALPLVWSHPGMWHWCLSKPLEAFLSFSVASWDINAQRGRKMTFWKVYHRLHGSKSEQTWPGAQPWYPSNLYF